MIPKKIHYCWFGGKKLPDLALKCIESWKKYFPDYEIIEWNESNFDINFNQYAKEAYENKKYAFFTDVARLYIIYNHGGIYFDVDVEVIKKFDDDILKYDAFFGLEKNGSVATGLGFGAQKGNILVKKLLDDYSDMHFIDKNGEKNLTPCPIINSKIFKKEGFLLEDKIEVKDNIAIFPSSYFNPKGGYNMSINIKSNTLTIHHFDGSWLSKYAKERAKKRQYLYEKYGEKKGLFIYRSFYLPYVIISNIKELFEKYEFNKKQK